jgi:methyl-accepting chemotaxis protein
VTSLASRFRAGDFDRLCRVVEFGSPIIPLMAILGYLALTLDLSAMEWAGLLACFIAYVLGAGLYRTRRSLGPMRAISEFLAERELDESKAADLPLVGSISAQILVLPLDMRRSRFVTMLVLALLVPLAMTLCGFEGWLSEKNLRSFSLSMLVAALCTSTLQFYWARSGFRPLRAQLGGEFESASMGGREGEAVERSSLARSLQFAIVMPTLATLILTLNLISEERRGAAEADALGWSRVALSVVFDSLEQNEREDSAYLVESVDHRNTLQRAWPMPVELAVSSRGRVSGEASDGFSEPLLSALYAASSSDVQEGVLNIPGASEIGVFRRLDETTMLVAAIDRTAFAPSLLGIDASLGLLLVGLITLVWGLGELVGRDLIGSISSLRDAALVLAAGGRSDAANFETGDELGDLGRTLHGVGSNLQATTHRISEALDHVERMAGESMDVASELAASSASQLERLQGAMDLVVSIDARGCEVSQSAEALNLSVDESSSSIAELGAAGAELNETASVLSSKVDEVSNSMEQMVRSVKQVGATTEKLAGASEDTSSSMEEMASAMRVVDTSAETMASLSLDVVAKAEVGQEKVCQTIEGMEAIREATDAAERVIRGLGSRTLEIGGILDVIDDVADETNLLALNAAIIAAQAGEHGKAFSVVADEIKELADRVLASTKEIGGLIRSVQEESENAIGAIEAGSQSVMSGVDLSAEAGRTLEEITDASRQNGMRIGEIVSSVREQTKAAGHVVELMEKVRDSADEISTASADQDRGNEVIYRSALTMREVAQQVRHTTEEQSHGFGRIRESVEGVRSTIEHITGSLRLQAGACGDVSTFLQEACDGNRANDDAFRRLGDAMKELLSQASTLREDVERSQIS